MSASADAGTNSISKASYLRFMERMDSAKRRMAEANKTAAEERGVIRGILKGVEKEGGSKFAIKLLGLLTDLSETEREGALQELFKYADWDDVPLWRPATEDQPQGSMFDDDETQEAKQTRIDGTVYNDGWNSALAGGSRDDNPHDPGERNHQTWANGFNGWTEANKDKPKGPTIASTAPRGRGRPKKAPDAPKAAKAPKGKGGKKGDPTGAIADAA